MRGCVTGGGPPPAGIVGVQATAFDGTSLGPAFGMRLVNSTSFFSTLTKRE